MKTNEQVMAEIRANGEERIAALAKALYPVPVDGIPEGEFYPDVVEMLVGFMEGEGRDPRSAAELDAWIEGGKDWEAFLTANPVVTVQPAVSAVPEGPNAEDLQEKSEGLRKEMRKSFLKGEQGYKKGLLEAGRFAHEFVVTRMKLGAKRAGAVSTVEGDLNAISTRVVKANVLIRAYWASALLSEAQGIKAPELPYGSFERGWSKLIEAEHADTQDERYVLLVGVEDTALSLFKEGVSAGWDVATVEDRCQELFVKAVAVRTALREAAAKETAAKLDADKKANEQAIAQKAAKQKEADEAAAKQAALDKAVKEAADEASRKQAEEQAAAHQREVDAKRVAADEAVTAAVNTANQVAERAKQLKQQTRLVDSAKTTQERLDRKEERAALKRANGGQPPVGESLIGTLAKQAKTATAKDFANMLADAILQAEDWFDVLTETVKAVAVKVAADKARGDNPDSVFDAALDGLIASNVMSAKALPAIKQAANAIRPSVQVNGQSLTVTAGK
jgi:hypothetical protein